MKITLQLTNHQLTTKQHSKSEKELYYIADNRSILATNAT